MWSSKRFRCSKVALPIAASVVASLLVVGAPSAADETPLWQGGFSAGGHVDSFPSFDLDGDGQHDTSVSGNRDSIAVDDVVVPFNQRWLLKSIFVAGKRGPGALPPEKMFVRLYKDRGGTPSGAAPIASLTGRFEPFPSLFGIEGEATGSVVFDPPLRLSSGTYWVGVQAAGREWYWLTTARDTYGSPARAYRTCRTNPYGLFPTEEYTTDWQVLGDCFSSPPIPTGLPFGGSKFTSGRGFTGVNFRFTLGGIRYEGLTFQKQGDGDGVVSTTPSAIRCLVGQCKAKGLFDRFESGSTVRLRARPAGGSVIAGWEGCDSVSAAGTICSVTMNSPERSKQVRVRFDLAAR